MKLRFITQIAIAFYSIMILMIPSILEAKPGNVKWYVELYSEDRDYIEVKIDATNIPSKSKLENVFFEVSFFDARNNLINQKIFPLTNSKVPLKPGVYQTWIPHPYPLAKSAKGGELSYLMGAGGAKYDIAPIRVESGKRIEKKAHIIGQLPLSSKHKRLQGTYTIQQKSSGRYMDAHQDCNDNSIVTRSRQNNNTQRWILTPFGNNTYTIRQKSNGQYVDAHEGSNDNSMVTRKRQNNNTQRWILMPLGNNTYTIRQKSNGQYADAHEGSNDNSMVTRKRQNNNTQRWILTRQ